MGSRAAEKLTGEPLLKLEQGRLTDPIAETIRPTLSEPEKLGERLRGLEISSRIVTPEDGFRDRRKETVSEFSLRRGV